MTKPLRVLLVEDSADDAELVLHQLRHGGFAVSHQRVIDREAYVTLLLEDTWDLVISDFSLPRFNGLEALTTLRAMNLGLPFILVSGTIGEEVAVKAIQAGAQDYLLKDRLGRLVPAVERALREVAIQAEQRAAEAALRDKERRFRLLVESVGAIPWEADDLGHVRYFGPQAEALLGHPVAVWYQPGFWSAQIHPADQGIAAERLRPAVSEGARAQLHYRLRHADGSWRWFLDIAATDLAPDTSPVVRGFLVDITPAHENEERRLAAETARHQLEQQLLHAQKLEAIGTLAGGIAHDFNNILTSIGGFSHLLERCLEPGHRGIGYANGIAIACRRAQEVVRQILTFSRHHEPSVQALDVGEAAKEALHLLRASIPSTIAFDLAIGSDLPPVQADPGQVHQVLMNLGTNACYAMQPAGGTLSVAVTAESSADRTWVVLRISDTGCGMSPETQARIFEPFFSTKPKNQGTGLGLSVVHGIVLAHHGDITVTSQPGQGTTFRIRLPASTARREPSEIQPTPLASGHDREILVIDDEPMIASITGEYLVELGFRAEVTTSPEAGIRLVSAQPHRFAAVITDLTMPALTGTAVAARILEVAPHLPVLLTSGDVDAVAPNQRPRSIRRVLGKPYSIDALATALHAVLTP
jgi:hypothetical protein